MYFVNVYCPFRSGYLNNYTRSLVLILGKQDSSLNFTAMYAVMENNNVHYSIFSGYFNNRKQEMFLALAGSP